MTGSVAAAIAPKVRQAELERSRRKPTESLDAYDYHLHGLALNAAPTKEVNDEALRLFSAAIELDPEFASPYVAAARCYLPDIELYRRVHWANLRSIAGLQH